MKFIKGGHSIYPFQFLNYFSLYCIPSAYTVDVDVLQSVQYIFGLYSGFTPAFTGHLQPVQHLLSAGW